MRRILLGASVLLLIVSFSCSNQTEPTAPVESPSQGGNAPDVAAQVLPYLEPTYPAIESIARYDWPDYLPSVHDTSYDIYTLTVVWGHTSNSSTPNPDTTDWSGTVHINFEGFIEAFGTISFEAGVDSVIAVDAPVWVPWESRTQGDDFDGLTFVVFFKRRLEYFAAPQVSLEMAPFSESIPVANMVSLTEFHRIDAHNGVIIHAHQLPLTDFCPKGTVAGRWLQDAGDRGNGTFSATWGSRDGVPLGYLIGTFATVSDGSRTLSGWVTGIYTDHIIAWVDGTWYYDDYRMCPLCGEGHGVFEGTFEWADGSADSGGTISGTFGDFNLPPDQLDLPMDGIWKVPCPMSDHFDFGAGASNMER